MRYWEVERIAVESKCCKTCFFRIGPDERMRCSRRVIGKLYVDAFFVCPLWVPEKRGTYV